MAEDKSGAMQTLTIRLPETLAKRLRLASERAQRSPADTVLEILERSLPRLDTPVKRAPYS